MKQAGVDSCPGGGAEISIPGAPHHLRPQSQRPGLAEHRKKAHEIGLPSNATMLYGHVETEEERVDHLVRLREVQDQTHGFVAFISARISSDNTPLSHIPKTTGYLDLRNNRRLALAAR